MLKSVFFLLALGGTVFTFADLPLSHHNLIPPRLQWEENSGYCGEICFISGGLYYGQYLSQYDAREASQPGAQQTDTQLLLGMNDQTAAAEMRLNHLEWNSEKNTDAFLLWVKQQVLKGYPVAIGVYTNEYLFYGDTDPDAGDAEYDHIVCVTGIGSNYDLEDPDYHGDDILYFSDNGLWGDPTNPPYLFQASFALFQANRQQANAKTGPLYSLSNATANYAIALTRVADLYQETLPVRLTTNRHEEKPEIEDGSNTRPPPMPLVLTITLSDLEPNVLYILYRYDTLDSVPTSAFNAHAKDAAQQWEILIQAGTTYTMKEDISSNQQAIYRAVNY